VILIKECKSCKLWFNPAQDIDECPFCEVQLVLASKTQDEMVEYNNRVNRMEIMENANDRRN